MSKTFFISDTHFDHANIIKFSKRPYKDAREMDDRLIENINKKVAKEDVLYHLGDFTFSRDDVYVAQIISRINCKTIYLVEGNHDHVDFLRRLGLRILPPITSVKINGFFHERRNILANRMVLSHYPIVEWDGFHKGVPCLYGHCHGHSEAWRKKHMPLEATFDIGVECTNYEPLSWEEVRLRLSTIVGGKESEFRTGN